MSKAELRLFAFSNELNFDTCSQRYLGDSEGAAGMCAFFAEEFDE